MLQPPERQQIRSKVLQYAPGAAYLEVTHAARSLVSSTGKEEPLDSLADRPVAAFCGIGNPAGFRHTLETCGYRVAQFREFPDHHRYDRTDVESLTAWADPSDIAAVLCTQKDLVKLRTDHLGRHPLRALRVGLEILSGREALESKLQALSSRARGK